MTARNVPDSERHCRYRINAVILVVNIAPEDSAADRPAFTIAFISRHGYGGGRGAAAAYGAGRPRGVRLRRPAGAGGCGGGRRPAGNGPRPAPASLAPPSATASERADHPRGVGVQGGVLVVVHQVHA